MKPFILNDSIDKEKVFILNKKLLDQRLDAFYYLSSFRNLENKIKSLNPKPLKDYIVSISSGATPKTSDAELYYSDKMNGIPFLRVQNITEFGIDLTDVKYISKNTHTTLLKRSTVLSNDLLVTITGRLATATVAPEDFEGNINQHSVVIKTLSKEISSVLSIYLNSNVGQRLALRRATGGTRPALDYKALYSIPVIYNENFLKIINNAMKEYFEKEKQAQQLLDSIDDYLLEELGITLPEKDNSLKKRIFSTSLSKVSGGRFDPFYFRYCVEIPKSKLYEEESLGEICWIVKGKSLTKEKSVVGDFPVIAGGQSSPYSHNQYNHSGNIITISATGAYAGYVWYHSNPIFASDCSVLQSKDENKCITKFLFNVLKLKQNDIYNLQQGSGQPHVYPSDIKKIKIPLPKHDKQLKINMYIDNIRNNAYQLMEEAKCIYEQAKQKVDRLILGDVNDTIKAERQRKELVRNRRVREDLEEMGFIFPKKEDN